MAQKLLFVLLLGVAAGLPERYEHAEPPVSSYSLPKPAASGPEARTLTVPQQPLPYRFQYEVSAPETGDHKSASESRSADGVVRGEYSYVDPTGSLRTVRYTASDLTGFVVQQEVVAGFAEPPPAGAAPQLRTAEPDQTQGEAGDENEKEAKRKREEEKRRMEEELYMKREQEAKMKREEEEERKKKQEAERRRREEAERKREEEAERKREEEAERKKKEETERKNIEEAKLKREEAERKQQEADREREYVAEQSRVQEAARQREYAAEQRRAQQAAREIERRRRLFGLAPPRLVLPTPLLVASPTLTLLRTRSARPPPVTAVRIQGRGIDIAY